MSAKVDYKSAGVDIEAGNEAVRRIKSHVSRTHSPAVLTGLGSFGHAVFAEGRHRRHARSGHGAEH